VVQNAPFTENERFEITQAAIVLFDNLIVTADVRNYVAQWSKLICIFLDCIDREKGHFLRFPWNVSRMEMPAKSMEFLNFVQQIFIKRINAHYEAIKSKVSNSRW
jgi:hypothetical protein